MEIPTLFSKLDNIDAIKLRQKCISDLFKPMIEYMNVLGIDKMVPKKDFITVSKLNKGYSMLEHVDDQETDSNNFICMAYINNDFSGGDLVFTSLGISYSPKAGDIIAYKAKLPHMVTEVEEGSRYTIGYGLRGPLL